MTCVEVRDRLTEHALGALGPEESSAVERHLEWCAGCRKESEELMEGQAAVAMSLQPVSPPSSLEQQVVSAVTDAAGTRAPSAASPSHRASGHHLIRNLAVAALAAALLAVFSLGWAVAERQHAQDVERATATRVSTLNERIARVVKGVGGWPYQARLLATAGSQGFGTAIIVAAPNKDDFIFVDVFPPAPDTGPYTVRLENKDGKILSTGELKPTKSGDLVYLEFTGLDLSQGAHLLVLNRSQAMVMTGEVHPYTGTAGA